MPRRSSSSSTGSSRSAPGVPRLVEPEQVRVAAAREPAGRQRRDVHPAGTRTVGVDRERADGVGQALGLASDAGSLRRGQDFELLEELLEGRERARVHLVADARELARRRAGIRARGRADRRRRASPPRRARAPARRRSPARAAPRRGGGRGVPRARPSAPRRAPPRRVRRSSGFSSSAIRRSRAERCRRGPQPICASRKARAAARAPCAPSSPGGQPVERERSRSERLAQHVGRESAADPVRGRRAPPARVG